MAQQRFEALLERRKSDLPTYKAPMSMEKMLGWPFTPGNGVINIISCSDARVDPTAFLKLRVGEATVIRNAGARVTDDVFRSLSVMGTLAPNDFIALIHHSDCGALYTTDEEVGEKLALRKPEHAHLAKGANYGTFKDVGLEASIREDVAKLKAWRFLPSTTVVKGYAFILETGEFYEVE